MGIEAIPGLPRLEQERARFRLLPQTQPSHQLGDVWLSRVFWFELLVLVVGFVGDLLVAAAAKALAVLGLPEVVPTLNGSTRTS